MKRLLCAVVTFILLFFVASGVLFILGDTIMRRGAEIERLQEELRECRGAELE
jgi:hypothetical protein